VTLRIAIGQLCQETNTFNPLPTTRADFEEFGIVRGPELVERMAQTNELGGFIQALHDWPDLVVVPGGQVVAVPGGQVVAQALKQRLAVLRPDLAFLLMFDDLSADLPVGRSQDGVGGADGRTPPLLEQG
jgi:microcystin degradation protein MlrC